MNDAAEILDLHGVRPTAIRLMIYKSMLGFTDTFSLSDLEEVLDTVDKSTIFRTLEVFAEHHVIHETEDMHCHFYCESCHKTFCLDHTHIPPVKVPEGYELHEVEYLLKGLCPEC